ncbi:unnamed protein product [Linum trigynum]|uniref:Uncharacterized protein n=1 Tax=Linum trigynum TaxID=586398 RepID=A0AAV2FIU0_9ROSI
MIFQTKYGTAVEIRGDKWVPEAEADNFLVTSPAMNLGIFSRVSELIDHENGTWKSNILQEYFNPIDRARILSISLLRVASPDYQDWYFEKKGLYSSKSAYYAWKAKEMEEEIAEEQGELYMIFY